MVLTVVGAMIAVSSEREAAGPVRAPSRLIWWPELGVVCDDLARITSDPASSSALPAGFPGAAPFGLPEVEEVVVVVEPEPASTLVHPEEERPTAPHTEATVLVQAARWDEPLERLVEALDDVAAAEGWARDGEVAETSDGRNLVDVWVRYLTPAGPVTRQGTNCEDHGWFVFSRTERLAFQAPPCDQPALAEVCRRAWEVADVDVFPADRAPRQLRVEPDGTVVATQPFSSDSQLRLTTERLLGQLTMAAWNEAPPCPDDELFGPSPFCSEPFFIDPPAGPFTWTFDVADPALAITLAASFTPRPGDAGYDAVITVTARRF